MVKILLDKHTYKTDDLFVYVPECSCNNAFFTRLKFNHQFFSIVKLTTLVIYNDYDACPYELLSEVFSEFVNVYSGAIENDEYLKATTHEISCIASMRRISNA